MNTFSQIRDTKDKKLLRLELTVSCVDHPAEVQIKINGANWFSGSLGFPANLRYLVPLTDPVNLSIHVKHEQVKINKFSINGHEILPKHNQINSVIDSDWELNIPEFYSWYHHLEQNGLLLD